MLSGNYTGTVFIKNKKTDAAVVLNNTNITSENGAGPVLRFSSEQRTFIVVPAGTENTLTDTRSLNQSATMYDYKKGKQRINDILKSNIDVINNNRLPKSDELTFDNSYYAWVSSIFIDIRDSSTLFYTQREF